MVSLVLNCISLMTCDVERLSISLFAICVSSLVRCLQIFCHFKTRLVVSLLLTFKSSRSILDCSPLSDMSSANTSSQSVACLFLSLDSGSHRAENFNFDADQLIYFFFRGSHLWRCI